MTMDSSTTDDPFPSDLEDLLSPSGDRTLEDYLAMQDAIGDRTRFLVVYLLANDDPHTSAQLADRVGVRANTLHYHLNKLEDVGLVRKRREAVNGTDVRDTHYEATDAGREILEHGVVRLIRRTDDSPDGSDS
jgi:DNA-binding MarR family transcriptional regulator